jgi:hypothetical protein
MTLLKSFFDWGKNGLAFLWVPYAIVMIILGYQLFFAHKKGGKKTTLAGGRVYDDKPNPLHKLPEFWGMVILTVIAIIVHFAIQSSYKGS